MNVGFIGLGQMGLPMAENILKGGFPLWVYNRTKSKETPLVEKGARSAISPAALAAECDVLISMVANDEALNDLIYGEKGIIHSPKKPAIHISMSTISPKLSTHLEKDHQEMGTAFLAAPVTGRPEQAEKGVLWIFLAGNPEAKKKAVPILEKMSRKIFDLGEHSAQASLFKLCNNFMILSFVEAFSEAAALLEKSNIPIVKVLEIFGSSHFDAPVLHSYASLLTSRKFEDGRFALNLGLKDMRLLQECCDQSQVPMPFLSEIHEKLLISMNRGREKFDWSAIALLSREFAG